MANLRKTMAVTLAVVAVLALAVEWRGGIDQPNLSRRQS